jgi:hypothetical protein
MGDQVFHGMIVSISVAVAISHVRMLNLFPNLVKSLLDRVAKIKIMETGAGVVQLCFCIVGV